MTSSDWFHNTPAHLETPGVLDRMRERFPLVGKLVKVAGRHKEVFRAWGPFLTQYDEVFYTLWAEGGRSITVHESTIEEVV